MPEIFHRSSLEAGGYTLGSGVTYSNFQIFGHSPFNVPVLIILQRGKAISTENSLMIFQGISPLTVDFFFVMLLIFSQTSCGSKRGRGLD